MSGAASHPLTSTSSGSKRSFTGFSSPLSCPKPKIRRTIASPSYSSVQGSTVISTSNRSSSPRQSPFDGVELSVNIETLIDLPSRKSKKDSFTESEVSYVIQKAVEKFELHLRDVYSAKLGSILDEQIENLNRTNLDYVTRKLNRSDCLYMS